MKDRLAKGAMWVAGARLIVNLIGFASTIMLARLLLPSDFGLVAIASTVAALLSTITDLSVGAALVQHRDPKSYHYDSAWTLNMLRAGLLAGIVMLLAKPLAGFYGEPHLADVLLVTGAATLLSGFSNPKMVLFTRKLIFWQVFAMDVSSKLVGFIVSISIALAYQSYWAMVLGNIAGQITTLILSYLFVRYRPRISFAGTRELLSFSIWLTMGQIVSAANYRFDSLFLGYFLGSSSLGFYSYGSNLASLPTRETVEPIAKTLFPGFARMSGEPDRLRAAYRRAQSLMTLIALPVGFGFALVARPLLMLVIGEKWLPAVVVIQALASIFALQTLSSAASPLAMAMGRTKLLFRRNLANLIVRMPLIIAGVLTMGLIGVVYARVISGLVFTLVNMALARQLLGVGFREQLLFNWRSLIGVGAMALVLIAMQSNGAVGAAGLPPVVELSVLVLVGATTYVAAVLGLWLASGRPSGPETEILEVAGKLRDRLRA
jgi:O-antigen/teichoic acid export membrane protein